GMSRLEKGSSPPRLMPGNVLRFMPKFGSGRVLSATRAATTVPGTSAACQLVAGKPEVEMASAGDLSMQDDCICQRPSRDVLDGSAKDGAEKKVGSSRIDQIGRKR